jgi:hypothetical protein
MGHRLMTVTIEIDMDRIKRNEWLRGEVLHSGDTDGVIVHRFLDRYPEVPADAESIASLTEYVHEARALGERMRQSAAAIGRRMNP